MDLMHPANCLTFAVQRAARSLSRGFESAAKSAGLTAPQFSCLALLSQRGPMAMANLAEALGTDRTTLTRNLDLMRARGWVEMVGSEDQRQRPHAIAPEGAVRLAQAMPEWTAWQTRIVAALGPDGATDLLTTLRGL